MEQAALEARRAYKRAWAAANRDKTREYQRRYWTKRALQAKQGTQAEQKPPATD